MSPSPEKLKDCGVWCSLRWETLLCGSYLLAMGCDTPAILYLPRCSLDILEV